VREHPFFISSHPDHELRMVAPQDPAQEQRTTETSGIEGPSPDDSPNVEKPPLFAACEEGQRSRRMSCRKSDSAHARHRRGLSKPETGLDGDQEHGQCKKLREVGQPHTSQLAPDESSRVSAAPERGRDGGDPSSLATQSPSFSPRIPHGRLRS
jgi:hypothetical protein